MQRKFGLLNVCSLFIVPHFCGLEYSVTKEALDFYAVAYTQNCFGQVKTIPTPASLISPLHIQKRTKKVDVSEGKRTRTRLVTSQQLEQWHNLDATHHVYRNRHKIDPETRSNRTAKFIQGFELVGLGSIPSTRRATPR